MARLCGCRRGLLADDESARRAAERGDQVEGGGGECGVVRVADQGEFADRALSIAVYLSPGVTN